MKKSSIKTNLLISRLSIYLWSLSYEAITHDEQWYVRDIRHKPVSSPSAIKVGLSCMSPKNTELLRKVNHSRLPRVKGAGTDDIISMPSCALSVRG